MTEKELKEFYNKGLLAFEKQNYDYAIEIFSQIISVQYDHLEARHYLHLSLQKKTEGSKPSLASSVNKLFLSMQANAALKKGDTPGCLEILEKIIASNPSDSETLKNIADIFYKKGMELHAINNLEEAKLANPKDINALKKLGELYVKREDYRNAKSAYESALKINPNDTEVLKSLKNLDALGTMKLEFGSEKNKGFTLVEVLIVVIIIGILASIGIPQFAASIEKAKGGEARAGLGHIQTGEKIYYAEREYYTTNLSDLDINLTQKYWSFVITTPTSDSFTATTTRLGGTHSGQTIIMDERSNMSGNWEYL